MKAFIFDPLWSNLVDKKITKKLANAGIEIILTTEISPLSKNTKLFEGSEDRIICINPDYVGWKLKNSDYKDIPGLKGIFTESTGFEWVEHEAADELGIPVCNIRNFSTQAVAEWATTMMFNLARQTPLLIKNKFPLDFDKDFIKYCGIQLKGKTAGIVGLGHIGSAIAEICKGVGMNVVYWSKSSTNDSYQQVTLENLMETADVIFPTVAKNEETLKLISDKHIRSVKESAIIVDIAHLFLNGELILEMVKNGKLFGYGFEGNPGDFENFVGNVWAAPEYAWVTYESMYNSVEKLAENIIYASNNEFPNRIN